MTRRKSFVVIVVIIAVVSSVAGVLLYQHRHLSGPTQWGEAVDREQLSVFFPDGRGGLIRKVVDIQRQVSERARAEALLRELKENRSVPDRLRLYEMALGKDGVLYLDLSGEFIDRSNPEREITMTYAIVNSFIESFRGVQSVQLLVEGQPVYTRSGVLYILEPLRFKGELLEE